MSGGLLSGGYCPGGYCPGGNCPRTLNMEPSSHQFSANFLYEYGLDDGRRLRTFNSFLWINNCQPSGKCTQNFINHCDIIVTDVCKKYCRKWNTAFHDASI